VVQPKHGAFPEILAMTEGGVLCDPDDPEALAKALEYLLLDDAKRRAMGEAARFNSRAQFSAASMAGQFDKVLTSLSVPVVR
jgi:glycosyltransferase involved in cell wall biosynthesis